MDQHFRDTPIAKNAPAILALLAIWNSNFLGAQTHSVLSYDSRLKTFIEFVQQLEMESNGKRVHTDGSICNIDTSPIIWGGEGTNGQHAFHQLLHQGTRAFSADFVATIDPEHDRTEHHRWLLANCLSQSQVMLYGNLNQASNSIDAHEIVTGDHATTTILIDKLNPEALGSLIALYEHKVACLGMIWRINSFDQWGVELGKRLAREIYRDLGSSSSESTDRSTDGLIRTIRERTNSPFDDGNN
jgi:glucose-6-phosphate isomerase